MSGEQAEIEVKEVIARYREVTKVRRRYTIRAFFKIKRGALGLIILVTLTILSLLSPVIAPNPNSKVHSELSVPAWLKMFDPNAFDDFYPLKLGFQSAADLDSSHVLGIGNTSTFYVDGIKLAQDGYLDQGSLMIRVVDNHTLNDTTLSVGAAFLFRWPHRKHPYRAYFGFAHKVEIRAPPFINDSVSLDPNANKTYSLNFTTKGIAFNCWLSISLKPNTGPVAIIVNSSAGTVILNTVVIESTEFPLSLNTDYNYTITLQNKGFVATQLNICAVADIKNAYSASLVDITLNIYDPAKGSLLSMEELLDYLQENGVEPSSIMQGNWGAAEHVRITTFIDRWFAFGIHKDEPNKPPEVMLCREFLLSPLFQPDQWLAVIIEIDFRALSSSFLPIVKLKQDIPGGIEIRWYIDDIRVQAQDGYYGLMGTDKDGADIFAKIIDGLKISLLVGFVATIANLTIGVSLGLVSGYLGGKIDEVIMRFVDFMMSIPTLPLLLVLSFIFYQMQIDPLIAIILVLSLLGWAGIARVIRSQVLALKTNVYVEAARASGASPFYIVRKHILPGVWPLVLVYLMQGVVANILAEASLSFLGVLRPNWNSLGRMIQEASGISAGTTGGAGMFAVHWVFFPGFILMLIGYAFYAISDAYDEIINPKRRRRF